MATRRKFSKLATFEIAGRGQGSVRVAETGEVRLELPGRIWGGRADERDPI